MLSRYNSSVLDLDIRIGIELIGKAYEKQSDSMMWDMWLTKFPWMDEKSFISFVDFKDKILKQVKQPKQIKTKEEIIKQSEEIIKTWKGGNQ